MTYASSWEDYSFVGAPGLSFPSFRKALTGIHDHFIPHERNNYQPHILGQRFLGLVSIFMVGMKFAVLAAVALSPAAATQASAITVDNVFSLTNSSRSQFQLPALSFNSKLALAAQNKAKALVACGCFSHDIPVNGTTVTPWWFFQQVGYNYISAGENLAVDFTQAENVETAWMNSPGHRANILNKDYEEIGIGIASGQFQGHSTTFVVQMFGTPVDQKVTLQSAPTPVAPAAAKPAPAPTPTPAAAPAPAPTSAPKPQPAATPVATAPASSALAHPSDSTTPPPIEIAAAPATADSPPLQITDTSTQVNGDQMDISVSTAGPAATVLARYNGSAAMLYPKSDTLWQGSIPLSSLGADTTLSVSALDIRGNSKDITLASFSPTLQSNYQFLGAVKGATINILGTAFDPKAFEQRFYLVMMAGLMACMVMAIAVKRHIQHLSLVANSSFVVVLATLLWMTG